MLNCLLISFYETFSDIDKNAKGRTWGT